MKLVVKYEHNGVTARHVHEGETREEIEAALTERVIDMSRGYLTSVLVNDAEVPEPFVMVSELEWDDGTSELRSNTIPHPDATPYTFQEQGLVHYEGEFPIIAGREVGDLAMGPQAMDHDRVKLAIKIYILNWFVEVLTMTREDKDPDSPTVRDFVASGFSTSIKLTFPDGTTAEVSASALEALTWAAMGKPI